MSKESRLITHTFKLLAVIPAVAIATALGCFVNAWLLLLVIPLLLMLVPMFKKLIALAGQLDDNPIVADGVFYSLMGTIIASPFILWAFFGILSLWNIASIVMIVLKLCGVLALSWLAVLSGFICDGMMVVTVIVYAVLGWKAIKKQEENMEFSIQDILNVAKAAEEDDIIDTEIVE